MSSFACVGYAVGCAVVGVIAVGYYGYAVVVAVVDGVAAVIVVCITAV